MKVWQSSFYDAPEHERSRHLIEIKHKSSVELVKWLKSDQGPSQSTSTSRDTRHARESGAIRMGRPPAQRPCDGSMSIGISDFLMAGLRPPPRRRKFINADFKRMEDEVRKDNGESFDFSPEGHVQAKAPDCGKIERNIIGKPSPRVANSLNRGLPVLMSESYQAVKCSPRMRVGAGLQQSSLFDDNAAAPRIQPSHIIGIPKIDEDILTAHASKSGQSPRLSYHAGSKPRSNCFAIDSSNKRSLVIHDCV